MTRRPASLLAQLGGAVAELTRLLPLLEAAVAQQRASHRGESRRAQPHSRPPWDAPVAFIILDVRDGVRQLERDLQACTSGTVRARGDSDGNTQQALANLVSLAAGADGPDQHDAIQRCRNLAWRARLALGETEPVKKLGENGQASARCPWCNFLTLRMRPVAGVVFCVNPACKDPEGRRPVARVEFGRGFGEEILVWQDESIGLAVPVGAVQ